MEQKCLEDNGVIEQDIVGMEIQIKEESPIDLKESEYVDSDDFSCAYINNIDIINQEIATTLNEEVGPNLTSLESEDSQTDTINNEMSLETEKKKISWEEFRAKREKMGLLKTKGNVF